MRLYLAVALLMLAFVAYTEAQEETFQQKFQALTSKIAEITSAVADKAKENVQEFQNSEMATKAKNWIQERFETLRNHFQ